MKLINTNLHGWLDYVMGALVIASPWIFGFAGNDMAVMIAVASGALVIIYSLVTNYEMGILGKRGIPLKVHLVLDVLSGLFLGASPWLFHFNEVTYMPFVSLGAIEVITALTTDSVAYARLGPESVSESQSIH